MYDDNTKFDRTSLERTVRQLNLLSIRREPLTWEASKTWAKQFADGPERALAWLILRNLIFRTSNQLEPALRQAIKAAVLYFGTQIGSTSDVPWHDVLSRKHGDLYIMCGPPVFDWMTKPGKSGELITRILSRNFDVEKTYARDINKFDDTDRFLLVDDGTFTGNQLIQFLEGSPQLTNAGSKVAIVVAIAHTVAIDAIARRFPNIPVFAGEHLTEAHCFEAVSQRWIDSQWWPYLDTTPMEVYKNVCSQHGFTEDTSMNLGFGNLGVMLAYEHGVPDDSLRLLWDNSPTWKALIER